MDLTVTGGGSAMIIRIFIADDHAIVRDGVRLLLESQPDIQVVGTAGNGRDAVREVARVRPDVVVMDVTMPELNGIDATRQICERTPSARVVMLSMHSDVPHVARALRAGASGYVMKESAGGELIHAVRSVYGGARYLSEPIEEKLIDDCIRLCSQRGREDPLSRLSVREREILTLVAEGRTSREIGTALGLSHKTVRTYRYRVMEKLSIDDVANLVRFGIRNGLASGT